LQSSLHRKCNESYQHHSYNYDASLNAGLTLLGSLCGIYDAGENGRGVQDGLMQYDAMVFEIFQTHFIFSRYIYLTQTSLRTQATGKAKSQGEADFYR
jgi:hypothetical protein